LFVRWFVRFHYNHVLSLSPRWGKEDSRIEQSIALVTIVITLWSSGCQTMGRRDSFDIRGFE
jgi:hypothetical protein